MFTPFHFSEMERGKSTKVGVCR